MEDHFGDSKDEFFFWQSQWIYKVIYTWTQTTQGLQSSKSKLLYQNIVHFWYVFKKVNVVFLPMAE